MYHRVIYCVARGKRHRSIDARKVFIEFYKDGLGRRRLVSWQTILAGFSWLKSQKLIAVPYSLHALKAAEVGLGVACGSLHDAESYIQEGRLCIP